ncbi:MAG: hypothetical protein RL272_538 [Candidatus Parcubacteria bacterium]|jgi:Tfp pilus assembly protein PilO
MLINKRLIVVSSVLGFLSLAIGGGVGIPSALSINRLIGDIAIEQGKIDERYALRRYVRNSVANLAETKKQIGELEGLALQEGKELSFVTALEHAATSSGVTKEVTLETVNQKTLSPWEKEIPVKMSVHGDFVRVLGYLNEIERTHYAVVIESLQISPSRIVDINSQTGDVDADIAATLYWQAEHAPDFVHGHADTIVLPPENP